MSTMSELHRQIMTEAEREEFIRTCQMTEEEYLMQFDDWDQFEDDL
jgi:hypothetical protein